MSKNRSAFGLKIVLAASVSWLFLCANAFANSQSTQTVVSGLDLAPTKIAIVNAIDKMNIICKVDNFRFTYSSSRLDRAQSAIVDSKRPNRIIFVTENRNAMTNELESVVKDLIDKSSDGSRITRIHKEVYHYGEVNITGDLNNIVIEKRLTLTSESPCRIK